MLLSDYFAPQFLPFIQITIALIFGMILGLERVLVGRTAGPRTYGLVAVGACLITILTQIAGSRYVTAFDSGPVIASIINGVGFIGAGLIVLHGSRLSGLTTAAGIWVSAAIGIAVGYNYIILALFVTFLTLFTFSIMWKIERIIKSKFASELAEIQDTE